MKGFAYWGMWRSYPGRQRGNSARLPPRWMTCKGGAGRFHKKKKVNKGGKKGLWRGPEEGWWCRVKIHSKAGFTLVQLWFPAWGCLFTSSGANQLWIFAWIRTCTEPYWTVERSRPRPVWTGSIASQAHSHVMRIRCSKKSASNWHICEPSPKEMYGNTKKTYILTSMLQLWCDAAAVPHQLWE